MKKRQAGLMVFGFLFVVLFSFGLSWGQNPPTILIVVRASDDSLWKMTCDEVGCSAFSGFPGMFRYQPTVTWNDTAQKWVIVGTAADSSIWMASFNKNGDFNNDWQSLPGRTPSPAGVAGGPLSNVDRCWNFSNPILGISGKVQLRLADIGGGHYLCSGVSTVTAPFSMQFSVYGNAELVGGKIYVTLSLAGIRNGVIGIDMQKAQLDPITLNGTFEYIGVYSGAVVESAVTEISEGTLTHTTCQ